MIERYARPNMKQIWSDEGKFDRWLAVEIAACEGWAVEGTIPEQDMKRIRKSTWDPEILTETLNRTKHDVTAFLRSVTSGLGEEGRWIHLGLTSSDVWDTATAMQLRDAGKLLLIDIDSVIEALAIRALENKDVLIMGRTHGVHAEPTTFGLKLAIWWDEMRRNKRRLEEAVSQISVGKISGAVGTHATVPLEVEEAACKAMGLSVAPLSNQIVQRDRHAHFMTTLAIVAASLEKFATEIRGLQRTEVHEVEEQFGEGQTGSSAMPHKRNPELSERICGLARLIRGYTLTSLENVALWHERDISHSSAERLTFPDATMALDYILDLFDGVIRNMSVFPDRMMVNIESTAGLIFSQRVMLKLISKGLAREDAYKIMQTHAADVWDKGGDFRDKIRNDPTVNSLLTTGEIDELFDYRYYTRHVDALFSRAGLVEKEIKSATT